MKRNPDTYATCLSRRKFLTGAAACALFGLTACAAGPSFHDDSQALAPADDDPDAAITRASTFAFDTVVDLGIYGNQSILDEALAACNRFDQLFSLQREGSDIWNINHAAGAPCEVAPDTADVIMKSLAFCAASEGTFDITIGAVSTLWDFKEGIKPDDAVIQEAITHVNWKNVSVQGTTVQLSDPLAALDLGGIAKGWIADALADLFRTRGVTSGIINLGGNVFALGEKPSGKPWLVGIRDPNTRAGKSVATVEVRNRSVVTSGLYERHFVLDGVDYYHILDPQTGYPAKTDIKSDTIISERSLDGDGLSTTLFIYGSQHAAQSIENRGDIEAIFMTDDGHTSFSSGFDTYHYRKL